ncbi:histone-lysine N-methyltransferase SETMAR [Trichonephila clavipes]|nr:histone-lysine N-methyltransferase SETMAR [Trichonephila clavipes]
MVGNKNAFFEIVRATPNICSTITSQNKNGGAHTIIHLAMRPSRLLKSVVMLYRPLGKDRHPDLTPSDFHLFLHLKSFLAGKHFNNDKELKENVSNWLKTQAATFYEEGIEKLVPRYDTCLQNFGSYVERGRLVDLNTKRDSPLKDGAGRSIDQKLLFPLNYFRISMRRITVPKQQ